ncbi:MAG: hypothetical protein WB768_09455, partial [Bradyrhizobium sp.]
VLSYLYIRKITTCRCNAIKDIVLGGSMQECAMRTDTDLRINQTRKAESATSKPSFSVWAGGVAVRTIFLIVLTVLTARVASPQMERLSSIYETPGDLVRVLIGVGVCGWFIVNVFKLPKDAGAYRTWMYLGLAVLPLSLLCAFVVW